MDGLEIDDGPERETIGDFGGVGSNRIGIGSASSGEKRGFPSRGSPHSRSEDRGRGRYGGGRVFSLLEAGLEPLGARRDDVKRVPLDPATKLQRLIPE